MTNGGRGIDDALTDQSRLNHSLVITKVFPPWSVMSITWGVKTLCLTDKEQAEFVKMAVLAREQEAKRRERGG